MYVAKNWKDYEVIDTGGGEKLERWGDVILRRPDPQIIWPLSKKPMNGVRCMVTIIAVLPVAVTGI